ncbi:MAG: glycoside hydrolase family 15 protein [bacterium]|nr:glycoside hydrolase family 15 protein [bacterium]
MPRSIVLGNGKTLIGLDQFAQVRDLYFPRVGLEDQVRGHYIHRIGIFVDGKISWFSDDLRWQIDIKCEDEALASDITATHPDLEVAVHFKDLVYNENSIFVRKVTITNNAKRSREIKIYFGHQFELYKSHGADTAYFDPIRHAIVHYKGQRVFMINGEMDGAPFSDYTIGLANFKGMEGSHKDAEDGNLSKNPIEHGPVDSVIGFYAFYSGSETKIIHYWMVGAKSILEACTLNNMVLKKTPEHILNSTTSYWKAWVNKYDFNYYKLKPEVISLFKKSLMYVRAHVDEGGAIIASADSDMLNQGKDTYAYMWPRDAAFAATALDRAGDLNVAKHFFQFCKSIISEEGYFMHKYLPDKSLGSSWHPYIRNGQFQLPIQEDETALVIWALWEHYHRTRDIEFVEDLFNDMIERAAEFMVSYRDPKTKLPKGSYDLWEEKYGTSTFTSSAVYGALTVSAEFAKLLGKTKHEEKYRKAAEEIKEGILHYLYDQATGNFVKLMTVKDQEITYDRTIDISSVYGIFNFGVLPINDKRLQKAMEQTIKILSRNIAIKGVARYEGDNYYRIPADTPGNPWVITTLWVVQYRIALAQTEKEFEEVRESLNWVARYALPSGVLSEQLHPFTGEQVSAAPLTWSHAEFVNTVIKYLNRLESLGICVVCNPVP